ncbi:MAG: ATP-binding cassette domain-containing protein, partial [Gammaproteobacteria bacterium]
MSLTLDRVHRVVDGETHIHHASLTLEPGSFNVLLGRTLAGKTSLMRLMAGLDQPTSGHVKMFGEDVTGQPVQKRNISMVYQQFINYPNLTVRENIASPLRLARMPESEIRKRVDETAAMLRIEPYLNRYPLQLSGGQQQRTAMARALAKDASLILFDEPLVNLDYKLREELRQELRELFKARNAIAVYATTEPAEALALGGTTTLLHEGRVIQSGPSAEVYRNPCNVDAAQLFSEPP